MATTTAENGPESPAEARTAPGRAPAAGRAERARVRAARALDLRTAGWTFARIAQALEFTDASAAKKAVERALAVEEDAVSAKAETMRAEQNRRINRLLAACWSAATSGDVQALNAAVRLLERQAHLNGLDAPTRLTVSDGLDAEIEALLQEQARLMAEPAPEPG